MAGSVSFGAAEEAMEESGSGVVCGIRSPAVLGPQTLCRGKCIPFAGVITCLEKRGCVGGSKGLKEIGVLEVVICGLSAS